MYTYNQSEESKASVKAMMMMKKYLAKLKNLFLKMIGDLSNEVDKDKQTSRSDRDTEIFVSH